MENNDLTKGLPLVYYSSSALQEKYRYMKSSSIARWLKELERDGILFTAIANKYKYDRTKSYLINFEKYDAFSENIISDVKWDKNLDLQFKNYCKSTVKQNDNTISQNDKWTSQNDNTISQNDKTIPNQTTNQTTNQHTLEGTRHFDNPIAFLKYFIAVEDNKRFELKLSKLKSLELLLNDFKAHFEEKQMSFDNSSQSKNGLLKYFDLYLDICIAQAEKVTTTPQNEVNNVFNDCKTYFENTFNQVATEHELKYELPAILNSIKKTIELKNKKQGHTNFAASTEQKVDLFKQICDNLPEFYQDKVSLKTIANNYNSILSQVKKTVHKEEAIEDKLKSLRSFYNNNPKLMHRVRINAQVSDETLVTMIKDFVQQCTDFYTMTQEQTHNELIAFLRKSSLAGHKKYNLTIKDEQAKQRILKQTIKS
jgi:hypothetical protein